MKNRYVFMSLLFAALSFTACSEKHVEEGVYASEATLNVLQMAAARYDNGDFGTPNPEVVAEIKTYDQAVYNILVKIRDKAAKGEAISASEEVALTTTMTAFQNLLIEKGIVQKESVK